jgi:hypothetical protein
VAVKAVVLPVPILAEGGATATEVSVGVVRVIVITAAELCLVTPFSVALTKRARFPALLPAVKVTVEVVLVLSVPNAKLVMLQE